MIFRAIKTYRDLKSGVKDPTGFGKDLALDVIKGPLILFSIIGFIGVAFFFILGFTELILPSLGFFKFLFFFSFIVFFTVEVVTWNIFFKIKALIEKAKQKADESFDSAQDRKIHVVDAELK